MLTEVKPAEFGTASLVDGARITLGADESVASTPELPTRGVNPAAA